EARRGPGGSGGGGFPALWRAHVIPKRPRAVEVPAREVRRPPGAAARSSIDRGGARGYARRRARRLVGDLAAPARAPVAGGRRLRPTRSRALFALGRAAQELS